MYPKDLLLLRRRLTLEAPVRVMAEAAVRVIREAARRQDGPEAVIRDQDMWIITATDTAITGQAPMAVITAAVIMAEDTTDKR